MFYNKKSLFLVSYFVFVLLFISASAFCEELQISVKGIAKGTRNRQMDYNAAVLDAKIKAIEQAGAEIESLTQIRNYQVKEKTVESKSQGIILPGYKIEDIGYVADGTYQVVLIGKIQVGSSKGADKRFINNGDGTVTDTKYQLMWPAKDNGSAIYYMEAKEYCNNYRGGGYTDWRMPDKEDLEKLFDKELYDTNIGYIPSCGAGGRQKVYLTNLITLSCYRVWIQLEHSKDDYFSFNHGFTNSSASQNRYSSTEIYRALPVRSARE